MTVAPAETSIRRPGLRQKWRRLPSSDAIEHLLEESALWTALWAGYPLYDKPDLARNQRSQR